MSDTVVVALIGLFGTVFTVGLVPLVVYLWKSRSKETARADTYESEGTVAISELERENEELQLELEASERREETQDEMFRSLVSSYDRLADAYQRLSGERAVRP